MVKVLVSIDEQLLGQIDAEARRRGVSRSALLSGFAAKELGAPLGPGARPEVRAALRRLDVLFAEHVHDAVDSTQVIRAMRDAR